MQVHTVDLNTCMPQGKAICTVQNALLHISTLRSIPTQRFDVERLRIRSRVVVPGTFQLPLRIDLTVKLDMPGFYVLFGDGHINFGTLCTDNRRMDDIVSPDRKTRMFHNRIPMGEWAELSVLYDLKEMQILVDGQERYYSDRERYMRSPLFQQLNASGGAGFPLRLACDKLAQLDVKAITITEFDDSCGIVHSLSSLPTPPGRNEAVPAGEKPTFDLCVSRLPQDMREAIAEMDAYLKSLRVFHFKRQIEKSGNKITYVSPDHGFSYAIYLSNELFSHSLQWYLITSGPPETWHRKDDRMEAMLTRLADDDPALAQHLFDQLDDCVGCYQVCRGRTPYRFQGKRKQVCHGKLFFTMNRAGFTDVRTVIDTIGKLAKAQA